MLGNKYASGWAWSDDAKAGYSAWGLRPGR